MSSDNIKYKVYENFTSSPVTNNSTTEQKSVPATPPPKPSPELEQFSELFDAVKRYALINKPKLYILTPCYNGMCFVNYTMCLMNTIDLLKTLGIEGKVEFCKSDSLIPRARNNLIARAMNDPAMTHIIFIDNDITWSPYDILKMFLADKDVIGGIYPLKHYNWERLINDPLNPYNSNVIQSWIKKKDETPQLKNVINNVDLIKHSVLSYNVNYLSNQLEIENNLTKVKHTATGFLMIKRNVFTKMFQAFPSTKYVDDVHFLSGTENDFAYALFDCGVEEGHYLSEDWLFCSRWTKMGGSVYIDVSINLTHTGLEDYQGSYITFLLQQRG